MRLLFFFGMCLLCLSSTAGAEIETGSRTISREPDPITITGVTLPEAAGLEPTLFGLYAVRGKRLVPIPFQVDQRDEDGEYILADVVERKQPPPRPFDENDELLFMAKDLGDRCSPELYPPDRQKGIEIEVIDPVDNTRGWSYLFVFESPPELSGRRYTTYLLPREGKDVVDTAVFFSEYPPVELERANIAQSLMVKETAGGSGENILDRMKMRVTFKFLFSYFALHIDEDNVGCELLAYRDGPVRLIRRVKSFTELGFGLKAPGFVSDMSYYETIVSTPMDMTVPFKFGYVLSEVSNRLGFDYSPAAVGSLFYNSRNLRGFLIDGYPSQEEMNMNPEESGWNVLTGPKGTLMRRSAILGLAKKYIGIKEYIMDNMEEPDPPENFPGNVGHTYQMWDFTNVPRGKYKSLLNFYVPSNFEWGDQLEYLKINDHPLEVVTRSLQ